MGLVEAAVPAKHRAKFAKAVDARRKLNMLHNRPKPPTPAQIAAVTSADYKAMNSLPLHLQVLVVARAGGKRK